MQLTTFLKEKDNKLKLSFAIVLVGVGAGLITHLFHIGVKKASQLIGTNKEFDLETFAISFLMLSLSYLLAQKVFSDTQGSGIPQVKLSLAAFKGKMPKRMPFGKFINSFLTLVSGLSMGKEGPMVAVSASWGHLISHFMKLDRRMTKTLVASGASAGLAAAFNTPIAAVIFTVEELMGELNTKYLGPIMITSVIASVTAFELRGNVSTFIPLNYSFEKDWHLFLYIIVGLIMSMVGNKWVSTILFLKKMRTNFFVNKAIFFILFTLILTALASLFYPAILGDGIDSINLLLEHDNTITLKTAMILFLLKFTLSAFAYSTGLSGGLFMPVLFIGASGGAMMGFLFQYLGFEHLEIGVFVLIGMTSLLASVIRAPFTAFVMLFEMTRGYNLILPLMVSTIVAYYFSSLFSGESVYEAVSEYEGVHLPGEGDRVELDEHSVENCMIQEILFFQEGDKIVEVMDKVEQFDYGAFPLLAGSDLCGIVHRDEILSKYSDNPQLTLGEIGRHNIIKVYPDQSILVALDKMKKYSVGRLLVVSRFNDKRLIGMVTPQNIMEFIKTSKEEKLL